MISKTISTTTTAATMRRPFRTFFTLSLTIVILFTVSSRTMISVRSNYVQTDSHISPEPSAGESNSTLLRFAAIDFNEAKDKEEIEQLLKGKFAKLGRNRFFSSLQYFDYHNLRTSFSAGWKSFQSSSLKYYRIGSEFQKSLRLWSQNKGFQPEIMLDLVDLIKRPIDKHYGLPDSNGTTRYPSCAVVGNSGILLNTEYGELIDSHDVVIRLNNALTNGFQPNVGSKTNISFVNSNILHRCSARAGCFCHPYGEKVPIVMYVCQAVHFIDYVMCNPSHKAPLLITDARFDTLCARIVKYYSAKGFVEETGKSIDEWATVHDAKEFHYSSGMQAIMLALGTCDKVSIFGFGKSEAAKHHYHSNQKSELHLHDYKAEYAFYHDLINNPQAIPFFSDKFKFSSVAIYN